MKIIFAFFLAAITIILGGCSHREHPKLRPGRIIAFALPSDPLPGCAGIINDKEYGRLFYFSDLQTKKQVTFCDSTGKVVRAVPFAKVVSAMQEVNGIAAISKDSILALSIAGNSVLLIDGTGKILTNNKLTLNWQGTEYLMLAYSVSAPNNSGCLYARLMPHPTPFEVNGDPQTLDNEAYCTAGVDGPAIVEIQNPASTNISYRMMLQGVQKRAVPALHYKDNFATVYDNDSGSLYFATAFSDSIYRVGIANNQVLSSAHLDAAAVHIGIKIPNSIPELRDATSNYMYEPIFSKLSCDRYHKLIYLSVYHEVPVGSVPSHSDTHRPWTLLVYDAQLHKVGETDFEGDTYEPGSLIVSPEGFWLKKLSKQNEASKIQYQLFTVL